MCYLIYLNDYNTSRITLLFLALVIHKLKYFICCLDAGCNVGSDHDEYAQVGFLKSYFSINVLHIEAL